MPKKKSGGDHKTPRVAVQIPEPWWSLARQLASKSKQPTLWYLLGLIAADAENNELPHPKLPWEEEA